MAASGVVEANVAFNPLLTDGPFPAFSSVEAKHVVPGIRALLKELLAEIDEIEKNAGPWGLGELL